MAPSCATAWHAVGVRTTEDRRDLLAQRKGALLLCSLKHTVLELRLESPSPSPSLTRRITYFPGLIHPPVFSFYYSSKGFFYLVSWENLCWCNESHSYTNFLCTQPKFFCLIPSLYTPLWKCLLGAVDSLSTPSKNHIWLSYEHMVLFYC